MNPGKPSTDRELLEQTNKWLAKLEKEMKDVRETGSADRKTVKEALENVRAYMSDCRHFQKEGDLVRAFEAVIYAWGIYETMLRMHLIIKE